MDRLAYLKQKLKIEELRLEIMELEAKEEEKKELVKAIDECHNRGVVTIPVNTETMEIFDVELGEKPHFAKSVSTKYSKVILKENGDIKIGKWTFKLSIVQLLKFKYDLYCTIGNKPNTPHYWRSLGEKYGISSSTAERIAYNLYEGTFNKIIIEYCNYHITFNSYGEIEKVKV